jgi:murein DD-endopeptidase MepM/ murein hydrolase activator NlpD
MNKLELLNKENRDLRNKIETYATTVDSIAKRLDIVDIPTPVPTKGEAMPYINVNQDYQRDKTFVYDPYLDNTVNEIERKLIAIVNTLSTDVKNGPIDFLNPDLDLLSSGNLPSIYPTFGRISDGWGMRIHPIYHKLAFHFGIDFSNDIGTPIYATAPGKVIESTYVSDYGKVIKIEHGDGYETRYGHLYSIMVRAGDVVKKGQIIALMGSTGVSTGPHLHYEVLVNGNKVNPTGYLNRLDNDVLVLR